MGPLKNDNNKRFDNINRDYIKQFSLSYKNVNVCGREDKNIFCNSL